MTDIRDLTKTLARGLSSVNGEGFLMVRPSGWDVLGLDGDPTPGVVESVQDLARRFGDFAHDVEAAYGSLNGFGADANALGWVGQTAEAFKGQFGPLPGRLQKLYVSYSEASDALSAYAPKLQSAQAKADSALRQAQDAQVDLQRATASAANAAADLKTAQQNHAASPNPNPQAVTDAQTEHDNAQTGLKNAQARMDALKTQAHQAHDDLDSAAKDCAKALHHAQSDGIHNKHWWEHVGEFLSEWGGKIADIANDLAPFLDVLALATSWIPGVDVITAGLAEADNMVALIGTGMEIAGDTMQGHFGDALMAAGMLGAGYLGGKALSKFGGKLLEKIAARGNKEAIEAADPVDVISGHMITSETDLALAGVLALELRRTYSSGYANGRLFGPGWSSTLDVRVSVNPAGIHFTGDDAQQLDYPLPEGMDSVLPEDGARWPLTWDRDSDEIQIRNPETGHTYHFPTVHDRNEIGQIRDLTTISDRNCNRIKILRDADGTPTAVEHAGYRVAVETVATVNGPRVSALRLIDGSENGVTVREFRHDSRGRLCGIVNSSGLPYTYEYDDADRVVAWTDRVGFRYTYEYDGFGRAVRGTGDGGILSATLEYHEDEQLTAVTDSLGHTTTYQYDEHGHLVAVTDPLGATTLTEYDRYGRLLWRIDALGNRTVYELDAEGRVRRATAPDEAVVEYEYNRFGQATVMTLPDGAVWQYRYDDRGNLLAIVDPLGAETEYSYRSDGAPLSRTDAAGATITCTVDPAGLTLTTTDAAGLTATGVRDSFGRLSSVTGPDGATTAYGWTVEGLPAWSTGPDGVRIAWEYDAEGQLLAQTDALGGVTHFEPGPFDHVYARTEPNGDRYEFTLDTEMKPTSVTNADGSIWRYEYDAADNLVAETDYLGRVRAYHWDAAGQLINRTDGLGREIALRLDSVGRIVSRRTADGEYAYRYDRAGRMVAADTPEIRAEFVRDAVGRVVAETVDGRTVRYEHDAAGRRVGRITPGGTRSVWSLDAAGRPGGLDAGAGRLDIAYGAAGQEIGREFGGTAWLARETDVTGRPTRIRLWASGRPSEVSGEVAADMAGRLVLGKDWTFEAGIPVASADTLRGSRRFRTDALGRVTALETDRWTETYAYDAAGNLAHADAPGLDDAAGPRETDRTLIRSAGRTHYDYDEAGRLVRTTRRTLDGRRRTWRYEWDANDQLVLAVTPDEVTWQYSYDALHRRVRKTRLTADGNAVEQVAFVWDGFLLAEQLVVGADGRHTALAWHYEPGSDRVAAQTRRSWAAEAPQGRIDEAFHAIVTDLVGAPTELVTPDGRIAWQTTTTLWGHTIGTSAEPDTDCPLRFPGQYHDAETGLHYNVHRYYDPATAAYLSPDPLGIEPAPNDHAYVSNPLTAIDPLGLAKYKKVFENDGGRFGDHDPGTPGDGLEAHHIPQDALLQRFGLSRNDGGAIVIKRLDHKETRTYGWKGAATKIADANLSFKDLLRRDLQDLRRIGQLHYGDPNHFNEGVKKMLKYYRSIGML